MAFVVVLCAKTSKCGDAFVQMHYANFKLEFGKTANLSFDTWFRERYLRCELQYT